jgi:2-dehydro-3-deoxyphosphogluconate aldolase / (4S)-4-hydroxy-2-oxoglutarate aldolase
MPAIERIMRSAPVIPVLTIADAALARPIAEALVAGGLPVLEVTLRTPAALDVLREMQRVPGAIVGAGTVVDVTGLRAAMDAGAAFAVSPGLTERLATAARDADLPFLPGVSTASDILRGLELGLSHFKFFPAESSGGVAALRALSAPFAQCRFCPTGGITRTKAAEYLALPSVLCVGGSWLLPADGFDAATVTAAAREAAALPRASTRRES